ncbi:MAG: xanthine dehydrogenase family protein molybdopterin-binding subunit [Acidimicrobiales bacterium]|nr:xanthine dehydrogenase family protein molybdopterin-binding subunit [Acidimicrobiales bacterium]
MSILGNSVVRREDPALLRGEGTFIDGMEIEGALHATFVRSTIAHARISSIEVRQALELDGVVDVVTAADIDLPDLSPESPIMNAAMGRPLLARDTVRFVGEPVAVVLTEERYHGPDAAELVIVDYEPLAPVVDPLSALAADAPLLFPAAGSNVGMEIDARSMQADFSGCDVVVRKRIRNQRVAPAPIEPRVAAAWWEGEGEQSRLVLYLACQGVHPIQAKLMEVYGLPADRVRVVCPDVGGSFGAKAGTYPEWVLLGALSRRVGRPVRWTETRTENLTAMGHGRGQVQDITIGGTRDGRVTAYRLEVVQDAGAYPAIGALLPWMTRSMVTGVYDIPNAEFSARSVVTNTTPVVAYRGAGRPEAAAAIERAMDLFATEIGMDPAEVRRRNFIPADAFPYTNAAGTTYDCGAYEKALDLALEAAGYEELRAEQERRRQAGDTRALGIGLATYVEITAFGGGGEFGSCELRPDGSVLVKTGSNPYGQGHHTVWSQLVSARLGIPMEKIEVVHGDTDLIPSSSITGGSRSVQLAGTAVWDAAGRLVDLARQRAADHLEAAIEDIVFDQSLGRFYVAGTPAVDVTWAELGAAADGTGNPLVGLANFSAPGATFPFGAHVAVVEVDTETGSVELSRLIAVDDAGTILNPLLAEGQVHGGLAQGAAQALLEEVRYDADGNPLTSNFADYGVISACELPMFERIPMETPTPVNPLGAKGIGESGTIGATPAVQNAVIDAVAHLGVDHIDPPLTPERVWRALQARSTDPPSP